MSDRKAKMLERVRALLAKADSTTFPEEAQAFRQKADEIMTAYAIEQWQVVEHAAGQAARPKPEVRNVNFDWYYEFDSDHRSELYGLMFDVARHCRVVVGERGYEYRQGMPIIGLPSDIDYFDLLFTSLLLQAGKKLVPPYDPTKSRDENVYVMRMAGMGWPAIAERLWKAGIADVPRGKAGLKRPWLPADDYGNRYTHEDPWRTLPLGTQQAIRSRLAARYREYAKSNSLAKTYVDPRVYQRSFIMGYVQEVDSRLRQMRRAREGGPTPQTGSQALALRDIRQQALDHYNELFPPPPPVEDGKKSKALKQREVLVDWGAYGDGSQAGKDAEITGAPGERLRKTPEIGS